MSTITKSRVNKKTKEKLPKLTYRQRQIVWLLYDHRFLNRIQIQAFLKQKDYKNTNLWLKDLRAKHYVEWIYSTDFAEKTKPAIYYLGINGIRLLTELDYPVTELRKRYKDSDRSQMFIDRCKLIADCCLTLDSKCDDTYIYYYDTEAAYLKGWGMFSFLTDNDSGIRPDLCFEKSICKVLGIDPKKIMDLL